jgi:hypothetical protein
MSKYDEPKGDKQGDSIEQIGERIFLEMENNKGIQFFAVGIGNVINRKDGRGADGVGAAGYIYDHASGRMVEEPNDMTIVRAFDKRSLKGGEDYFDWEYGVRDVDGARYIFFRTVTPGARKGNVLIADHRPGSFTFGIRITANLATLGLSSETLTFLSEPQKNKKVFQEVVNNFGEKCIPDYLNEIIQWLYDYRNKKKGQ